jgi:hypothetical protein
MSNYDEQLGLQSTKTLNLEEKPVFFNILLILSASGNGLAIMGGLFFYGMSGFYIRMFRLPSIMGQAVLNDDLLIAERIVRMMSWWSLSAAVGSVICLIGLYLMWKSRKIGFVCYVFGQLVPIGCYIFFVFVFTSIFPVKPFLIILILFSLLPAAFILMFGLHLKYLK